MVSSKCAVSSKFTVTPSTKGNQWSENLGTDSLLSIKVEEYGMKFFGVANNILIDKVKYNSGDNAKKIDDH